MADVSIIVPTYNEADQIIDHLKYHTENFEAEEFVVVDGGSTDGTISCIKNTEPNLTLIQTNRAGRAYQLRKGIQETDADYLLFLHADSYLPADFTLDQLQQSEPDWGWFDCRLDDRTLKYRILSHFISLRSALFSSPTGDQAIWVKRSLLRKIGGIPDLDIMEDVELNRRLSEISRGKRFKKPVATSARRWKQNGFFKTILLMWSLKLAYFLGISPSFLSRIYYGRQDS